MIRALRRGGSVGLLPDQVPPDGMGVWAPFFGQPAYTMTLAARLARQTGAPIGVVWCERMPGGRGFTVRVQPLANPLPDRSADGENADPAALELADATAINRSMEAVIAQRPEQYLWGYNRYKAPRRLAAP
jgi:KDO2-lipid IV(A) lauroyltransferase